MSKKTNYSIYVIELDKNILELKKFREENPNYIDGKPCVYVGYTSKSPEERFEQHITCAKNKKGHPIYSKKVKKYASD